MSDRELLESAARAAGLKVSPIRQEMRDADGYGHVGLWIHGVSTCWNPLTDDGDAFRLAARLGIGIAFAEGVVSSIVFQPAQGITTPVMGVPVPVRDDAAWAARRAIVGLAAEIGKKVDAPQAAAG